MSLEELEAEIKQLRKDVEQLKIEKANCEPFRWLQHRVGQLQRRLDNIYGLEY